MSDITTVVQTESPVITVVTQVMNTTVQEAAPLNSTVNLAGTQGLPGPAGAGVPVGGAAGQVLVKKSATAYDTEWQDPSATASADWNTLTNKPTTFAPSAHTHVQGDITGLATALAGKADSVHTHGISDVTGLQTALDGKQAAGSYAAAVHTHAIADVSGLQTALDGKQVAGSYATATHTHAIADVTNLQTTLNGKANTTHTHAITDVTGLQAALDGKQASGSYAAATHTHAITDVTGLQTALDGKQASGSYAAASHTHTKSQITDFAHTHAIADLPVATSGTSSSTQVVRADDSRLSDARTPTAHTHTASQVTDFATAADARIAAASINALSDVVITTATSGQVLKYNGTNWVNDTDATGGGGGGGDMLKSTYDTNNDGKVDAAAAADSVPWTGVSGKPSTFAPAAHTHTKADITDFAHTHVKADITDFAHTHAIGDLPVAASGTSSATQVVRADDSRLSDARTPTTHTHTKSQITDFAHTHAATDITTDASNRFVSDTQITNFTAAYNDRITAVSVTGTDTKTLTLTQQDGGTLTANFSDMTTPGSSTTTVILAADVTNSNATANTLADVTGLSFSVVAGTTYYFRFFIWYTAAATTTGSRWTINGPATTLLSYRSEYSLTATSRTFNDGLTAYGNPAASNASSILAGNTAVIEGIITPSANGTVIARFASEIASSAIVAKAKSFVRVETM